MDNSFSKCTQQIAALGIAALLTGCGSLPQAPEPVVRTQTVRVEIPVAVACLKLADVPAVPAPTPVDAKGATTYQLAAAAAADVRRLEAYAATADALLRRCAN